MIAQAYIAFLKNHCDSVVFIFICVNPVHLWLNFLELRYVQEMLGHARLETTQIYTHVHIDALREVHARTHPHGRLGPGRDMHGLLTQSNATTQNEPETDFTSNQECQRINAEIEMVAIEHLPAKPVRTMAAPRHSWPMDPPEDDPPAGNVPKTPPRRPKSPSGGNIYNSLSINELNETEPPQKTEVVAVYTYRWYDPLTSRWPSRDPIEERGGMNLYGFVGNDGINSSDNLGMMSLYRPGDDGEQGFITLSWSVNWDAYIYFEYCCGDGDSWHLSWVAGFGARTISRHTKHPSRSDDLLYPSDFWLNTEGMKWLEIMSEKAYKEARKDASDKYELIALDYASRGCEIKFLGWEHKGRGRKGGTLADFTFVPFGEVIDLPIPNTGNGMDPNPVI